MPSSIRSVQYALMSQALRRARRLAGISQKRLGARIGKSGSHIHSLETGRRRIEIFELYHLARALGVEPVELFEEIVQRLDTVAPPPIGGHDAPMSRATAGMDPPRQSAAA